MPFLRATEIRKVHEEKIREQEHEREIELLSMINSPTIGIVQNPDVYLIQEDDSNKIKGKKYELYVGSLYAKRGFNVDYNGINKNSKDGGIDLVCKYLNHTILIQCKCYITGNIRVKDIYYFYGAVHYYAAQHIDEVVESSYWITRKISPKQRVFSVIKTLGITLYDGIGMPKSK